ncbi:hypothetical protein [Microbacterium suaedae]|uniref:hypothetical protein n=1 Tax=Microbacterium suaedae TaxID=2067813 RepID=UPI0013A680AB|nr:hypothetical protein [Microbacterium suaedae]
MTRGVLLRAAALGGGAVVVLLLIGVEASFAVGWGALVAVIDLGVAHARRADAPLPIRLDVRHPDVGHRSDTRAFAWSVEDRTGDVRSSARMRVRELVRRVLESRGIAFDDPDRRDDIARIAGPAALRLVDAQPITLTHVDEILSHIEQTQRMAAAHPDEKEHE